MPKSVRIFSLFLVNDAQLRSNFKNLCFVFHQGFKHSKTIKALGLRPGAFISFLVFGNPDETLQLVFEILLVDNYQSQPRGELQVNLKIISKIKAWFSYNLIIKYDILVHLLLLKEASTEWLKHPFNLSSSLFACTNAELNSGNSYQNTRSDPTPCLKLRICLHHSQGTKPFCLS